MRNARFGRRHPPLAQRLTARALRLALDPAMPTGTAADALINLARGNPAALDRALHLLRVRGATPPSCLASRAAAALGLALDRVVEHPADMGEERQLPDAKHEPSRLVGFSQVSAWA
jgi:hypothetical protein